MMDQERVELEKLLADHATKLTNKPWYISHEYYLGVCLEAIKEDPSWGQRRSRYSSILLEGYGALKDYL